MLIELDGGRIGSSRSTFGSFGSNRFEIFPESNFSSGHFGTQVSDCFANVNEAHETKEKMNMKFMKRR